MATITTNRTGPGEFTVLIDGQPSKWQIINGSHGYSGNGAGNTYGIKKDGKVIRWIGTLQACKKLVAHWANAA